MNIESLVRPEVREISPYTLAERRAAIKLDQNESPHDLPGEIKERLVRGLVGRPWNRYPQFEQSDVRGHFATTYGLGTDEVLVGNGSNELLLALMLTFVDADTTVIAARPSFSLYEHYARVLGARVIGASVDLSSGGLPVDAMIRAAEGSSGRAVLFVCSPNNPTGGVLREGELERLLATGAVVVLDRAYGEFSGDEVPAVRERLIVLSTLSKAFGLAGLRVGWLAAPAGLVREIRKVKLPYNLNVSSEEIAIEVLGSRDRIRSVVESTVAERERVAGRLRDIGIETFPSQANFILFRTTDAAEVFEGLLARGILVRDVSKSPGLANCLRVSVGRPDENDAFLGAIEVITTLMKEPREVAP